MKERITWQEFERLVEIIQKSLVSSRAVVRRKDKVQSLVDGQEREVDVTVRLEEGSFKMLIAVECRKRQDKQDVMWIEQLGTKKIAIGANVMVAVSNVGFTDGAVNSAKRFGVELRTLSEAKMTGLKEVLNKPRAYVPRTRWMISRLTVYSQIGDPLLQYSRSIGAQYNGELDRVMVVYRPNGESVTLAEMLRMVIEERQITRKLESDPVGDILGWQGTIVVSKGNHDIVVEGVTTAMGAMKTEILYQHYSETFEGEVSSMVYADLEKDIAEYSTFKFSVPTPLGIGHIEISGVKNLTENEQSKESIES